jgi:hypothetical protein
MQRVPDSTSRGRAEERLLNALAAGRSVREAARAAAISERTAYRRLANPGFQKRLAALRDELITSALAELVGCASEAVCTLKGLLEAADARVQLGAVRTVLEQVLKLREALSLEQRLTELERHVEREKQRRR